MCNLYSLTSTQSAIADLVNLWRDDTGNMPSMPAIYPDYPAPVVTQEEGGRVVEALTTEQHERTSMASFREPASRKKAAAWWKR